MLATASQLFMRDHHDAAAGRVVAQSGRIGVGAVQLGEHEHLTAKVFGRQSPFFQRLHDLIRTRKVNQAGTKSRPMS